MSNHILIFERGGAEIYRCAPDRHRLVWDGKYVATFRSAGMAIFYVRSEFLGEFMVREDAR